MKAIRNDVWNGQSGDKLEFNSQNQPQVYQKELDDWADQTRLQLEGMRRLKEINQQHQEYYDQQAEPPSESQEKMQKHLKNYVFKEDPENEKKQKDKIKQRKAKQD